MKVRTIKCLLAVLVGIGLQASVRADDERPAAREDNDRASARTEDHHLSSRDDDEHFSMHNFFFPVGVGISSGHFDVFDKIKDLYRSSGFQIRHETLVPVGITFNPYYEFNCGFGVGLSLGPTAFFEVREENGGFGNNNQGGGFNNGQGGQGQGQGQMGQGGGFNNGPGQGGGQGGQGQFGQQQGSRSVDKFSYIIPVGADVRYTFLRCSDVSPYVKVGVRYPIAGGDNLGGGRPGPYAGVGVELFRRHGIAGGLEFGYDASRVRVNGPNGFSGTSKVTYSGFTGSLYVLF
jgi:hypothetical protein